MQIIQSSNLPLWLSSDGVNYKQLVCVENYTVKTDTTTNETETFCGLAIGVGVNKTTIDFSAVCEAAKTATQVTNDDIANWQTNGTLIWWKIQYPSPGSTANNIFYSAQGYITSSALAAAVNTAVKFSGTITSIGTTDITP